ncbi:MAG: histidine phosphatase family protein [Bacilli bacterium]
MIICLVRHGQTNWNKKTLLQGLTDNELNENGINQAKLVGQYLKTHDSSWDAFVSSPLKRAVQTAEVIKEELDFKDEIILDEALIERDFGVLEGMVLDKESYDLIFQEVSEGLEKKKDLEARSFNALINLEKRFKDKKILAFSHAQFIKSIITQLDPNFNFRSLLKNSSMNYFEVKNGKISIIKINISAEE